MILFVVEAVVKQLQPKFVSENCDSFPADGDKHRSPPKFAQQSPVPSDKRQKEPHIDCMTCVTALRKSKIRTSETSDPSVTALDPPGGS